ncbi:hypothetical protein [Leptolyngbya sp. BC1307]|uniref:hypothetical protein n=1 Tax=Leptolyngbya sp. BC1307 TaxID=2029589 RepID=UPI001F0A74FB|nr:hypothetical protein [Leptolyngbya sp. BC1307]
MSAKPPKFLSWLAVAGLAWGAGFVYNVYLGGEAHWLKGLYQNKVAIAAETSDPKLIITGGSGAHYTVDSALLSQELGMPVVNLGLDGPLGLDVILASVLEAVQPGDVVLLIPEYLILEGDGFGPKSGLFGIAVGKPGMGGVPAKQLALDTLQLGIPSLRWTVKSVTNLAEEGRFTGYYDGPLTAQGDPTETKQREGDWWPLKINSAASPHAVERIAQFKTEVEDRGGQLIVSIPWVYGDVNSEQTIESVRDTAQALGEIAPVLVDEETLNIQDSPTLFADTHYHLKPEGREVRSQQLAQQLKPLLLEMQ